MRGRISRPDREINRVVLPRVGFIKVGMKNAKGYPQSVDYFVPSGKYAGLFTQAYGDRPQTIQIVCPDDDAEKVCREEYQYRDDAGKLIAWGDGETFNVWDGQKYNELSVKDYPKLMHGVARKFPNRSVRAGGDGWQVTLTLTFIIPLVRGVAGVWQFVTKGAASSIPGIRDTFDAMLSERGFVKGIIWDMNVQFAKSQKPGETSRYPVVSIVPNESEGNVAKVKEAWRPVRQIDSK